AMADRQSSASEDMLSELNQMISEYGEETLKQLEESMEMLENMEVVDPHMSEEDLEKLKRKHRLSENKAIVKAEMEYLKGLFKHYAEAGGSAGKISSAADGSSGIGLQLSPASGAAFSPGGSVQGSLAALSGGMASPGLSISGTGPSIDIQV
ncbi:MAG: hypothetical protein K5989_10975, partial [Lachnospiraceae bacterium]|nr:hypothetical protein [Lachnospiraceae bacterium]